MGSGEGRDEGVEGCRPLQHHHPLAGGVLGIDHLKGNIVFLGRMRPEAARPLVAFSIVLVGVLLGGLLFAKAFFFAKRMGWL
jgi:hypothetical protein